jgi:hypothetical protein
MCGRGAAPSLLGMDTAQESGLALQLGRTDVGLKLVPSLDNPSDFGVGLEHG